VKKELERVMNCAATHWRTIERIDRPFRDDMKEVALRMATNPQLRRELTHGEAISMAKIDTRVDDLIISLRLFAGNQLADVAAAAIRQAVATAVGGKLAGD
jgi:hypothetical protein